jgi:hypothetical protein
MAAVPCHASQKGDTYVIDGLMQNDVVRSDISYYWQPSFLLYPAMPIVGKRFHSLVCNFYWLNFDKSLLWALVFD